MNEIPDTWIWTTIGDICKNPQYGWTTKSSKNGNLKLIRTTDITSGEIDWEKVPYCVNEPDDNEKYKLSDGDIVISRAGSVGVSHIFQNPENSVFASYLIRFVPLVNNMYLYQFLQSSCYWNSISEKKLGIAVPNVNATKLKQITIPLPPLNEQHRIVDKIESLFSKLDAGAASLQEAKTQLERYRQSVLKSAMEGRLSQKWREAHKDELEPASVLLERIRQEREKEQKGKKKRKELPPIDTSELPEIPDGWEYAYLNHVCEKIQDGSHFSPQIQYSEQIANSYPYVTAKNIKNSKINLSNITYVTREYHKKIFSRCNPKYGDILLVKDGVNTGNTALNNLTEEISLLSSVTMIRPINGLLYNMYLYHYIRSPKGQNLILGNMTGTAIKRIILKKIKNSIIIIPAYVEQIEISNKLEKICTILDYNSLIINNELNKINPIKQSILKKAFEGRLVPQDPRDEPASVLLEKIKAEREAQKPKKKKRSKKQSTFSQSRLN